MIKTKSIAPRMKLLNCLVLPARAILLLLPLSSLGVGSVQGQTVYYCAAGTNNTNVYDTQLEFGDEVCLVNVNPWDCNGKTNYIMTEVQFEYYGDFATSANATARLHIYKPDGPVNPDGYVTPGTVLFDSESVAPGGFSILPGYQTKAFGGLAITIPDDVIWTVQFHGLLGASGSEAGLVLGDTPTVGSSYNDFWVKPANGSWVLKSFANIPVNDFAARIFATPVTETPTLSISRSAKKLLLVWNGTSTLQVANDPAGPYEDVTTPPNQYTVDPGAAQHQFWRLKQ
jgi:hypothetical protein